MSHGYSEESAIEETEGVRKIYPDGIHEAIAAPLREQGFSVQTAILDEPEHGLTETALDETDVIIWWGHMVHDKVDDMIAERVYKRIVDGGMGFIALHWGAGSKVFRKLMDATCSVTPLVSGTPERLWVIEPAHPIAHGLEASFLVPQTEIYGEPFDIPAPDTIVFISSWPSGEVCRSGCCFQRGRGRVFFFRPGHETYPIYYQSEVQQVIANSVAWAARSS
ncbi:MAG: ThuA domain-containing protein [Chloroflexota bacterium]|nr:ThuA domain-containing protein [Chloroflexota bacterium]MDE2948022.1 ThuA domain-containing protein [Chloroflexota bacterium]